MSKPWGGVGAWAAEAEREEAEEKAAAEAAAAAVAESQSFPSLKEAANAKGGKKKKTTMSLHEFRTGSGAVARDSKGLTPDEMFRLPTGPKERSAEEMQNRRGFSSYGQGMSSGRGRDRDDGGGGGGGRRSYGGFDDDRRGGGGGGNSRASDFEQMPSRADEVDSWKTEKKSLPSFDSARQSRFPGGGGGGGGGSGGGGGGASRADETDNWAFGKKPASTRPSNYGFRDSEQPDRWSRGPASGGGFGESERERPRLVLAPPRGNPGATAAAVAEVKVNKSNPFGAARPREEVLAEKGLDWKKLDSEIEAKKSSSSRPTSAHSSRPSSAQSGRSESGPGLHPAAENSAAAASTVVVKPRPKVNPFGDAKPREVLLEEKGKDWRKIDLELERRRGAVERPETEEEKMLKEEIENLKKALEEPSQEHSGEEPSLQDKIRQIELELERLTRNLDNKVRFSQKPNERPGSGAGRVGYHERPPSQSGSYDEPRNLEFVDRPRSRGAPDVWTRPSDDRRAVHGGSNRERGGFLGSRDSDRSRSREGW